MNCSNIPKHVIDELEQRWNDRRLRENVIIEKTLAAKLRGQKPLVISDRVFNAVWDDLLASDKASLAH